ncbi:WAP four-disulfide core domain 2 [Phyllostomus discolor]|uniref:WAP four-disulfide core domain 2 n=1 Tax=Phyllostomus discolor TaxID=89673 RepID=A0A833ZBT1_9CHIR|nr:WAP four-disulfide core domain 2 [Phyllostomus discolor]
MTAGRLGPFVTPLFLGLVLLVFHPGPEGGKAGVCPELENDDVNCTQECSSDEECGDYLKCCKAGCASVCYRPDEKPGSCPRVDLPLTPLGICRDQCPASLPSSEFQPPQPEE